MVPLRAPNRADNSLRCAFRNRGVYAGKTGGGSCAGAQPV